MQHKVTVIGGGNVGATAAQRLVEREIADVCLVDIVEGLPQGKALDMMESAPVEKLVARSDRRRGRSGGGLVDKKKGIGGEGAREAFRHSREAIFIVVSNPLDAMCEVVKRVTGLPRERVIGMAGILDSARMRWFIAEALKVSVENTHAFVLGGHGDSMVPLPRYSTVAGIPITELLPAEKVAQIVDRTRNGGIEIVNYLKAGSAYYATSSAVV